MKNTRKLIAVLLAVGLLAGCAQMPPAQTTAVTLPQETVQPTEATLPQETAQPTEATQAMEQTEPQPEIPAEHITAGVSVLVNGIDQTISLSDQNIYSKARVSEGCTLAVESETPFGALYFIWDEVPGRYTVRYDGGELECGEYGFLHEYVRLPQTVTAVEIRFEDESSRLLCDVEAYTAGAAPEGVQVWLPPCEEADILVFPTHSDDDALFFGALISYYAIQRQLKVQTAFMVEHTGYSHRSHERLNGLWAMGVRYYPVLGTAPDTGTFSKSEAMSIYADSDILGWQVEQIRRFRPLVVVGHDLEGEYGNGGHKVNAHYLTQAIYEAADAMKYPVSAERYGTWRAAKLYLHLYPEHEWYLDVNTPMENDPLGRTPFEAAQDGFAAHISQLQYGVVQQNDYNRAYDCRPYGLYYTCVGFDTKADVMDNIVVSQWRK